MNDYQYVVGIDVSKNTLDVCVLHRTSKFLTMCIANTKKALSTLGSNLKQHGVVAKNTLYCFENTGIYQQHLIAWGMLNKLQVWVENPMQIKKSMGLVRGKSDRIDAHRIALYAVRYQDKCRLFHPIRKETTKLRDLWTTRQRLIKTRQALEANNKENSGFRDKKEQKELASYTAKTVKAISTDIQNINKAIDQLIKNDAKFTRSMALITSVKGLGKITAIMLLVMTNEFNSMRDAKKIACYAGIAPFPHGSGTSIRGKNRVSPFACKPLKRLLHLCAISAKRNSPEMSAYYEKKVTQEKKPAMLVLNAIRNKLIARVCACIRDNRKYEENYTKSLGKS